MIMTCPACGCQASAEAWQNDEAARETMAILAALPGEVQAEALRYLSFFRPAKHRLSWSRARRLLQELHDLVAAGELSHNRRPGKRCPPATWAAAMIRMQERRDQISRPLPNHNYLIIVAYDLAGQEEASPRPLHEDRQTVAPASRTMDTMARLREFAHGQ
jgi:hypothetical protein